MEIRQEKEGFHREQHMGLVQGDSGDDVGKVQLATRSQTQSTCVTLGTWRMPRQAR